MKKAIVTSNAPGAIGPYSQGIASRAFVITSGQLPIDPKTGTAPGYAPEQARVSLNNCKAILEEAGLTMNDVIKTTVFIKNMDDFAAINEVYTEFFEEPYPARSCVEVARLPKDVLVEIECMAMRPHPPGGCHGPEQDGEKEPHGHHHGHHGRPNSHMEPID